MFWSYLLEKVSQWRSDSVFCSSDGFMHAVLRRCVFNSSELKDIEFIKSFYYNKEEFLRFSSSVGKYVGYTRLGMHNAELFNNDTSKLNEAISQKEAYCKQHADVWYRNILYKSGEFVFL